MTDELGWLITRFLLEAAIDAELVFDPEYSLATRQIGRYLDDCRPEWALRSPLVLFNVDYAMLELRVFAEVGKA